jgi:hypothetical protein
MAATSGCGGARLADRDSVHPDHRAIREGVATAVEREALAPDGAGIRADWRLRQSRCSSAQGSQPGKAAACRIFAPSAQCHRRSAGVKHGTGRRIAAA